MTIARTDSMKTNEDFVRSYRWEQTSGDPYLLSDAAIQVRIDEDSETALVDASVGNGKITLDSLEDGGWANIRVPKADLESIEYFGVAKYDLVLTRDEDGRVKTIAEGDMIIKRGITR